MTVMMPITAVAITRHPGVNPQEARADTTTVSSARHAWLRMLPAKLRAEYNRLGGRRAWCDQRSPGQHDGGGRGGHQQIHHRRAGHHKGHCQVGEPQHAHRGQARRGPQHQVEPPPGEAAGAETIEVGGHRAEPRGQTLGGIGARPPQGEDITADQCGGVCFPCAGARSSAGSLPMPPGP